MINCAEDNCVYCNTHPHCVKITFAHSEPVYTVRCQSCGITTDFYKSKTAAINAWRNLLKEETAFMMKNK